VLKSVGSSASICDTLSIEVDMENEWFEKAVLVKVEFGIGTLEPFAFG